MKWEDNIRKVVPYVPGEQPNIKNMIKLNTNECPYPPAPGIKKIMEEYPIDTLRLYPNPDVKPLVHVLASYYGLEDKQVFVGVGSDDVLATAFLAFFNSKLPIFFPDITYAFYDVWAQLFNIPYEKKPLDDDFQLNIQDYTQPNGGIVIANPNAPTGSMVELDFIENVLKANPDVIVIVDEAYVDFGGVSAIGLLKKYENLCVVQTFSKSRALAGSRVGFAMGNEKLIAYLTAIKFSINSYTINAQTLAIAPEAVRDDAYFKETIGKIIETRKYMEKELLQLGFSFPPSVSNFLFITHKNLSASYIFDELRKNNIFVRHFNKERIENYLRVSVGTNSEIEQLLDALRMIIANSKK